MKMIMMISQKQFYAITIFLSSFLLFLVQPLITKILLPIFGGGPMVWVTALVFFQSALFIGYLYAHLLSYLSLKAQKWIHLGLFFFALLLLPLAIDPSFVLDPTKPFSQLSLLLITSIGLPYLLLASTSPLLQYWISQKKEKNPYKLYAVSNIASLGALLLYPFIFEPGFTVTTQTIIWSTGFLLFFIATSITTSFLPDKKRKKQPHSQKPKWYTYLFWIILPAIASILLVATSNQIALDIAPTPLIWILPLLTYLLTFIITFSDSFWYKRPAVFLLFIASLITYLSFYQSTPTLHMIIAAHLLTLFIGAMICHGELVRLQPKTDWLTAFYLSLSFGGALGGIIGGLIAPQIFTVFWELPIALTCIAGIIVIACMTDKALKQELQKRLILSIALTCILLGVLAALFLRTEAYTDNAIHIRRNFYGIIKVAEELYEQSDLNQRRLLHGSTLHGTQFLEEPLRSLPTTYYGAGTPIGMLLEHTSTPDAFHLGVIGLGTGTLATYGDENDRISFYEIDPDIIEVAQEYFTYLNDFPGMTAIYEGDARITLQQQERQNFDILVVDAFSSDAIPTHLLTEEATAVYLSHLKPGGIIAFHISNRHLDLEPVLGAFKETTTLSVQLMESQDDIADYVSSSRWVLLSEQPLPSDLPLQEIENTLSEPWTDDYSNLLNIMY